MTARPRNRVHLPTLVGGAIAGALVIGALVPILTRDAVAEVHYEETTAPMFGGGSGGPVDGPLTTASTLPGAPVDATSRTAPPVTAPGGGKAPLRATTRGVTASTITLAVPWYDGKSLRTLGAEWSVHEKQIATAFVDELNARGGIHGRKVVLEFAHYDFLTDSLNGGDSQNRACLDLTQGKETFTALLTGTYSIPECFYQANKTISIGGMVNTADDPTAFEGNARRYWTMSPSGRRILASLAIAMNGDARFRNRKLGIVVSSVGSFDPNAAVDQQLIPDLTDKPAHIARMSADPATFGAQLQIEVGRMRSAGVDTVLLFTSAPQGTLWVQTAERNGWKPQYAVSDLYAMALDGNNYAMSHSFDGAIGWSTYEHDTRSAAELRCRRIWEAASGAPTSFEDTVPVREYCNVFLAFEMGATNAGPDLTQASMTAGMGRIGAIPLAGYSGGQGTLGGAYAYGPVKWTAADGYDPVKYDEGCGCFHLDGTSQRLAR